MYLYFALTAALTLAGFAIQYLLRKNFQLAKATVCGLSFVVLGTLSAFRYAVGYDYEYVYLPLYKPILENPFISSTGMEHEPGFIFLERICALLSDDPQMLFIVTSYMIIGLFMLYYYIYSPNPVVSIFLFLSLSQYYCSMNFIRQTLAGVICLYAIPFLHKRKFFPYFAFVVLAATFHVSALIMLVFYFINMIPIDGYMLAIYLPVTIILYLSSTETLALITRYIYDDYNATNPEVIAGFPIGFLIGIVLMFVFLFLMRNVLVARNKSNYVYVNYAFFSVLFVFLSTKHAVLDRFSLFFNLLYPIGAALVIAEMRGILKKAGELKKFLYSYSIGSMTEKRTQISFAVILLTVFVGASTIHYHALSRDSHGVIPYRSVLKGGNNSAQVSDGLFYAGDPYPAPML